ncbi:hypothetical protein PSYJA_02594 [Pseudomonas syringae pv. japonica str. M301072]|uniref:Uncharacterized protein n=1 Tax=Pseudomonas syringae pv. japonica str. M301072 TaxID=629262 RepID=F3FCM0_PSESX|nr:hypothetical protein PSYJA_02594 [Pseudomonas syringae pv. japonica str. M301072]
MISTNAANLQVGAVGGFNNAVCIGARGLATAMACALVITPPASLIRQIPPSSAGTIRSNPGQAEGRSVAEDVRADCCSFNGSPDVNWLETDVD